MSSDYNLRKRKYENAIDIKVEPRAKKANIATQPEVTPKVENKKYIINEIEKKTPSSSTTPFLW